MRIPVLVLGCAALSFGGGFVAGRAGATAAAPPPRAADAPDPRPAPAASRGLVCLRPGEPSRPNRTLEILGPMLELCESRLDRCEHRGGFRRHDWPEDEGSVESPDAWTDAVQESLQTCGIDLALDLVECTEYPCLAAFRPPGDADPAAALMSGPYSAYRKDLEKTLANCEPLRAAFGIPEATASELLEVWAYDAPCEGGNQPMMVLSALHPDGPANRARNNPNDSNEELRWMYRRAEDVAAAWRCGDRE